MFFISPTIIDKEVELIQRQYQDRATKEALVKIAKHSNEESCSASDKYENNVRRWLGYKFIWFGERLIKSLES